MFSCDFRARAGAMLMALAVSLALVACSSPPSKPTGSGKRPGTWSDYRSGTAPRPNPALKRAIIARAEQEWQFFGRQEVVFQGELESIPRVGAWEDEDAQHSERVNAYWRSAGQTQLTGMDCQKPWSAAFISWIMRNAGVPDYQFPSAIAHWSYIADLIEYASLPGRYFVPRRLQDYSPEPGDLICAYRQPSRAPLKDGYVRADLLMGLRAHCDLVTAKHEQTLEVIGGNVRNSVSKVRLQLNQRGYLQPMPRRPWFVILQNRL